MSTAFKTFDGQRLLDVYGKPIYAEGCLAHVTPESPDYEDIKAKLEAGLLVLERVN
jgi:hypothetical protein